MASANDVVADRVAALPPASAQAEPAAAPSVEVAPSRKQLFWTAAPSLVADAGKPEAADQSHVPPCCETSTSARPAAFRFLPVGRFVWSVRRRSGVGN